MRRLLVLPLLASALCAQEATENEPEPADVAMPAAGQPVKDRAVVKQRIERFKERFKAARKDEQTRAELLAKLGELNHPDVYRVTSKYLRDRSDQVALAAVLACARQARSSKKAGAALWSHASREKREDVRCVAMIAAGYLGYDKVAAREDAHELFEKNDSQVRKAAARYLGFVKDKSAFRLIAEKLDEPSYLSDTKAPMLYPEQHRRWTRWKSNRPWVVWALSQLVEGETFETTDEARNWAESEGKEHGIRW